MNDRASPKIEFSGPANGNFLCLISDLIGSIFKRIESLEPSKNQVYNVQLAVHEACTNIVDHAYEDIENGRIHLTFSISSQPLQLIVDVEDHGNAFDPTLITEPDSENLQVRGYGLFIIQKLMDETNYTTTPTGNHWRLIKNLS